jgi:ankyrin repeat protein
MLARELSGRAYREVGLRRVPCHLAPRQQPGKDHRWGKINVSLDAGGALPDKLRTVQDGDGSLLDHSMVFFGSGMGNSNEHDPHELPSSCRRCRRRAAIRPAHPFKKAASCPIFTSMLDKLGVPENAVGEVRGRCRSDMRQGRRGAEDAEAQSAGAERRGAERRAQRRSWCAHLIGGHGCPHAAPDERLIEAVRRGDQAAADSLLKQGVDVNGRQGDGATALHWAAHQNDRGMVERLLRAGADVQATNELGVTPLLLACTNGSTPVVEALLAGGADPNATAQGRETPLMVASWTGNADVVRRLLDAGADVDAKEASRQQTALMWAASERHPAIVRLLTGYGADVHSRTAVNVPNRKPGMRASGAAAAGLTALVFAARVGDVESTRLLLDAGANVDDTADEGLSALGFATVRGHVPVALLLLERGANANAADGGYSVALGRRLLGNDAHDGRFHDPSGRQRRVECPPDFARGSSSSSRPS